MVVTIVRASHPVPTFAVTTLSLLLAVAFGVPIDHTVAIVVAVFFNQIAIGLSNDVIDVARDRRAGRTDKPLVTGAMRVSTAWVVVVGSSIASLALSVLVNPWVGVWQAVFLLSGFAYNAGLRATVLSALPYATGFAALPILVSLGTQPPSWPAWWVIFVGASLGVSAHFANVLPDGESDRAEGIRGLPQQLPRIVTAAALVAITVLSAVILIWQGGTSAMWVTVPAAIAAIAVSIAAAVQSRKTPVTALPFRLSMLAAGFLVLGLVGALQSG